MGSNPSCCAWRVPPFVHHAFTCLLQIYYIEHFHQYNNGSLPKSNKFNDIHLIGNRKFRNLRSKGKYESRRYRQKKITLSRTEIIANCQVKTRFFNISIVINAGQPIFSGMQRAGMTKLNHSPVNWPLTGHRSFDSHIVLCRERKRIANFLFWSILNAHRKKVKMFALVLFRERHQ